MSRPGAVGALALALTLAGCGGGSYLGTEMQPAVVAPDVALTGAGGDQVSFARTGGQVTVTTFGFTSCPDVCPATLSNWRQVRRALGPDAVHVRFVFVSGDWRTDTPLRTSEFAQVFDPSFIGVTGDSATLHRVLPAFQAEVGYGGPPGSPTAGFAHSDFDYVVDETGRIALWYPFTVRPETLVRDLRRMLRLHRIAAG